MGCQPALLRYLYNLIQCFGQATVIFVSSGCRSLRTTTYNQMFCSEFGSEICCLSDPPRFFRQNFWENEVRTAINGEEFQSCISQFPSKLSDPPFIVDEVAIEEFYAFVTSSSNIYDGVAD